MGEKVKSWKGITMIESNVEKLRDPFVLVKDKKYYMYGSNIYGKDMHECDWSCYVSDGDLTKWEKLPKKLVVSPPTCVGDRWAPEVHEYQGAYYMFTTYFSSATNRRGCTILRSDSPEGPFSEITNGTVTPLEWDCIDGTLYVEENGQPWLVFVHEWVSIEDHIGRMAAAKLSEDLTHLISEPIELFRADDAPWAKGHKHCITDGCFLYTTKEGKLLMLWSNFNADGYCVGIAHSEDGTITGNWVQEKEPLYSKRVSGIYDGGHGMLFHGIDGQTYLSIHAPNKPIGDRKESPIFIPICERDGTLRII